MYEESSWSNILSSNTKDIVIIDILFVQSNSTDTIRIEPCYSLSNLCEEKDQRNNPEIIEFFQKIGKLIN